MINLLNKLFSRFNLRVISPEQQEEYSLVNETVKFLNKCSKDNLSTYDNHYVGDIQYLQDKNGKHYYQDHRTKNYFCDYDMKKPSKEVLGNMIAETKFTPDELKDKLKND